jgi:hypothetical protein
MAHYKKIQKKSLLQKIDAIIGNNRALLTLGHTLIAYILLKLSIKCLQFINKFLKKKNTLKFLRKILQKLKHLKFMRRWLKGIDRYNQQQRLEQERLRRLIAANQQQPNVGNHQAQPLVPPGQPNEAWFNAPNLPGNRRANILPMRQQQAHNQHNQPQQQARNQQQPQGNNQPMNPINLPNLARRRHRFMFN